MTERATPVETAKAMRAALRDAFPGVRFALRTERGTGWGFMDLHWDDGPTSTDVQWVLAPFLSERPGDEPDDSVVRIDVPWTCKGVALNRHYSERVMTHARTVVDDPGEYNENLLRALDMIDLRSDVLRSP